MRMKMTKSLKLVVTQDRQARAKAKDKDKDDNSRRRGIDCWWWWLMRFKNQGTTEIGGAAWRGRAVNGRQRRSDQRRLIRTVLARYSAAMERGGGEEFCDSHVTAGSRAIERVRSREERERFGVENWQAKEWRGWMVRCSFFLMGLLSVGCAGAAGCGEALDWTGIGTLHEVQWCENTGSPGGWVRTSRLGVCVVC